MAEINGIAYIQLSVTDMEKSIPCYRRLLTGMGLTVVNDTPDGIYGVGGRTGINISRSEAPYNNERFKQHHPEKWGQKNGVRSIFSQRKMGSGPFFLRQKNGVRSIFSQKSKKGQ